MEEVALFFLMVVFGLLCLIKAKWVQRMLVNANKTNWPSIAATEAKKSYRVVIRALGVITIAYGIWQLYQSQSGGWRF